MKKGIYGSLGKIRKKSHDFLKADILSGKFHGLSTEEDLLKATKLPLPQLVDLAMLVRRKRKAAGVKTDCCASGYLPHQGGRGCEMNCAV